MPSGAHQEQQPDDRESRRQQPQAEHHEALCRVPPSSRRDPSRATAFIVFSGFHPAFIGAVIRRGQDRLGPNAKELSNEDQGHRLRNGGGHRSGRRRRGAGAGRSGVGRRRITAAGRRAGQPQPGRVHDERSPTRTSRSSRARGWSTARQDAEGTVQRVVTHVTKRRKLIANGITARVVHDVVTEHGEPVEKTFDWYAQDKAGNVWYLGEDTKEYENGEVASTHGSFEAGVDGAQPGVIMPASPQVGMTYRQEFYAGEAEDEAQDPEPRRAGGVPFGHFTGVLMTKELNPSSRAMSEYKFYAPRRRAGARTDRVGRHRPGRPDQGGSGTVARRIAAPGRGGRGPALT